MNLKQTHKLLSKEVLKKITSLEIEQIMERRKKKEKDEEEAGEEKGTSGRKYMQRKGNGCL